MELPFSGNDFLNFAFRLFHSDCFDRAGVNTNAAIHATIRIDLRLAIRHADSIAWAFLHTGLTTRAFSAVHFGRHPVTLSKKTIKKCLRDTESYLFTRGIQPIIPRLTPTSRPIRAPQKNRQIPRPLRADGGKVPVFGCPRYRLRRLLGNGTKWRAQRGVPSAGGRVEDRAVGTAAGEVDWSDMAMPRTRSLASYCATQSRTLLKSLPGLFARR